MPKDKPRGKSAPEDGDVPERHKAIEKVLMDMQVKLDELENARNEVRGERLAGVTPQQSVQMLEEIVVPSLELIREERKKPAKTTATR